jgi:hypothetical protein
MLRAAPPLSRIVTVTWNDPAEVYLCVPFAEKGRPHRAIDRRTPQTAWSARTRAVPRRQGIRIDEQFRVRKDRGDKDGKLTLRHDSRLHHIGVGRVRAGTPVLMLIRELDIRIITEDDGELVRELTLDPTRDYQPTGRDRYARSRQP